MERYRTTLIMLVLLVALAVAALTLNNRGDTSATPTPEAVRYVWESAEPVASLDIVSGTQKVVLKKDPASTSWTLEQPVSGAADSFAVTTVADSFKSLVATSVLTESGNLAEFGLDKPGLTVTTTFSGTNPSTRTLQIGVSTFNGENYYVKTVDANTVYLVSNGTIEPLRSWLTAPPIAPPTPTIAPFTVVPTPQDTPIGPATSGSPSPSQGLLPTTVITGSTTLTTSGEITTTSPGAANPTTPLPATPPAP